MMTVLLESAPAPVRGRLGNWTAMSVLIHSSIVAAVVVLTIAPPFEPVVPEVLVPITPWTPPKPASPPRQPVAAPPSPSMPSASLIVPDVTVPVVSFPDFIPSVTSSTDFPATTIFDRSSGTPVARTNAPFTQHEVERIVRPRAGNPSPAYPPSLRTAGIEGDVLARFVVDTLGRVERRTVEIVETSHAQFGDAVRDWIIRTRYEPATIGGRPVRQQVEQRIGFSLRR